MEREEQVMDDFHVLDIASRKWSTVKTLLGPIQRFDTLAFFWNDELFTFGGCDNKYIYGDMHALHIEMEGKSSIIVTCLIPQRLNASTGKRHEQLDK